MKRIVIFSVLVLLVIGTIGCGPETVTVYADKAPSISISTPTVTWTAGNMQQIQWSGNANSDYSLIYEVYVYLVPQEGTFVDTDHWDYYSLWFDQQNGRYQLMGFSTYDISGGASYVKIPEILPAGAYKLSIELAHYESGNKQRKILAKSASEQFTISENPNIVLKPLISTKGLEISGDVATMNARINPQGSETLVLVEYGYSETGVFEFNTTPTSIGSGNAAVDVRINIPINANTNYIFRVVAVSQLHGKTYGYTYSNYCSGIKG